MSNNVTQKLSTTAFTDLRASEDTPVTQISSAYGLLDDILSITDPFASGTTTVVDSKFTCSTGLNAAGLAVLVSGRHINLRPGQGLMTKINAIFTAGAVDSDQIAGPTSSENAYGFGPVDEIFGIRGWSGGVNEAQELTITVAAAGVETATVTVDGIGHSVPLTAGTVQHNAFEISNSLSSQAPNYLFTSNDDQVVAQSLLAGPQGSFAFSSTGTAVAAWVLIDAGVAETRFFVAQEDWNEDTRLDGTTSEILDPTKANEYYIQIGENFGAVKFYLEDSDTGDITLVHTLRRANLSTSVNVTNPSFRLGWAARNEGNTTDIICSGFSASAFIEGTVKHSSPPRAEGNEQLAVGTTLTNIITFRNRIHFGDKVNRANIIPLLATLSTQSNKSAFFEVRANPTFGGDLDFFYIDKDNSIMEVATDSVTVSGGRLVGEITVAGGDSGTLEFNTRDNIEFIAAPSQLFSISARASSGAASDMQATGEWVEAR